MSRCIKITVIFKIIKYSIGFYALFFVGSWDKMIAPNTRTQPMPSVKVNLSLSSNAPEMAAKTDSKLISREAVVGSMDFCPTICNV